jgi:sulfite reductase (ferredoxin)
MSIRVRQWSGGKAATNQVNIRQQLKGRDVMAIDKELRLEGIYGQRQKGHYMQRIKLPGGVISSDQALKVAAIAERFARGVVHLTTRGSIQLHWLTEADLVPVAAQLASVGLVSRGACGGAVRGVVCGSLSAPGAPALETLVRKLHRHFTGNPRFEKLPKKFKIGVEADTSSRRHLIQDVGLIPAAPGEDGRPRYDVWVAGGLGRLPTPGFLLAPAVLEDALIPLIEVILRIYAKNTPPPKRLKHLILEIGEEEFRRRVFEDPDVNEELPTVPTLSGSLVPVPAQNSQRLEAHVFAGELTSEKLAALADIARDFCGAILMVNGDQNIAMHLVDPEDAAQAQASLLQAGFKDEPRERVTFRVCPGNHECIYGLAPTRDVAATLWQQMGPSAQQLTWAISGCPNSCAQPQLADVGIVSSRLVNEGDGPAPRFDLYRPGSAPLAEAVQQGLTLEELLQAARDL